MTNRRAVPVCVVALCAAAVVGCGGHRHTTVVVKNPRIVSIEVEVFDPVTDGVWENVGVRVVEADVEWSGCVCENRFIDDFFLTDRDGLVFFPADYLAAADVGFPEDVHGHAILSPRVDADEAIVVLEVWADGFDPVFVEVELTWDQPEVFISLPFELVP